MKENHILPYKGNKIQSKNGFGWDCCFPSGQWGWKKGGKCQVPTLTLGLSISAVVEWLASGDWGSVWSWSVKTYTPTERRKMKDIFSLSSTFPKLSGVHFGSKLQHLKYALSLKQTSVLFFLSLQYIVSKGRLGYNNIQNYLCRLRGFLVLTFELQVSPLSCGSWCWSHRQLIAFHPVFTWKTKKKKITWRSV